MMATKNTVDLMREKLGCSQLAKQILLLAACIGATFDVWVLEEVARGMATRQHERVKCVFASLFGGLDLNGVTIGRDELVMIKKEGLLDAAGP